jgi:hypothetical protein
MAVSILSKAGNKMAIQNSIQSRPLQANFGNPRGGERRKMSRQAARKEKTVEAQEAIRHSHNGVEHSAPLDSSVEIGGGRPLGEAMLNLNRAELQERREKMAVALKGLKADKEDLAQQKIAIEEQLKNQTTAIQRTEGALFMLDQVLGAGTQEGG